MPLNPCTHNPSRQPENEAWGNEDPEPYSCPYPVVKMEETNNGKSHRTSTSDGDEIDEYDEDVEIGLGSEVPETVQVHAPERRDWSGLLSPSCCTSARFPFVSVPDYCGSTRPAVRTSRKRKRPPG